MALYVTLLEYSLGLSVAGLVMFFIYYLYNSRRDALVDDAESHDYADPDSYARDQLISRQRFADWSIFMYNDSKSIGLRFIFTSLLFFFIAGAFGILLRVSLSVPTPSVLTPDLYDIVLTQHATLMIYMWALGITVGLSYYLLPSAIRIKRDTMGNYSSFAYWVWLLGGIFIILSRTSTRWYFYPPLALQATLNGAGADNWLAIIGLELIFVALIIICIVVIRMILLDRGNSVRLDNMSIFAWSVLFTMILAILSLGPVVVALGMLFYDFFNPIFFVASSGNVLLFTILFWFWGHPIVYIPVIPFFGVIYELLPTFTGAKIYSRSSAILGLGLLLILSMLVWGHHLMNSGLGVMWDLIFSTASFLIVIPSAITVFNYIATLWTATRIRMTTPMLFIINGIIDFIIGGITGVMQSNVGVNEIVHGTYWVTGHFHFIFLGITTGIAFAAFYVLFPTFTRGRKYNERLARWHFGLTAIGSMIMSLAWTTGGFLGMPRAVDGYFAFFQPFQDTAILGGLIIGVGQLIFLYNIASSWLKSPTTDTSNVLEPNFPETSPGAVAGGGK
ncbi:MAG: cbb3-type cytochrome c oxidase subunit I [Thermoplasmataceae archaeon]